jgi:hypothetical protein
VLAVSQASFQRDIDQVASAGAKDYGIRILLRRLRIESYLWSPFSHLGYFQLLTTAKVDNQLSAFDFDLRAVI